MTHCSNIDSTKREKSCIFETSYIYSGKKDFNNCMKAGDFNNLNSKNIN